jgi:polyisoprenoid-binding protein YceI
MSRRIILIVAGIAAVGLLVVGAAAAYLLRTPEAQSGELTAIPLTKPTAAAASTAEGAALNVSAGTILAELVQDESEARFIVNEVLDNKDNTVTGVTNQVAAQIEIDPTNPANVQLGVVQIDVRDLTTDSSMRNRAIQNFVLNTNDFEFVTFQPTQFVGLPANAAVGDTFSFQIVGDLTIRDVTQSVTFDVTVTVESEARLSGLASTTISRADFNLGIPSVPRVASVDDDVRLELEFVAVPVAN